jgi:hypothetical protein
MVKKTITASCFLPDGVPVKAGVRLVLRPRFHKDGVR